jgi:hypothetical protein
METESHRMYVNSVRHSPSSIVWGPTVVYHEDIGVI